jgi:tetratricopeptide (TPR) repeat protein
VQNRNERWGWFERALRHYERSYQVCEEFRIEPELPNLLNKMAIAYRALGKTEKARETFTRSTERAREQSDNLFIANNLVRLAEIAYEAGDLKMVAAYTDELKQQFQEQGFRFGLAYAEMEELLAQVALDAGEYEEAFRHLGENYAHLARLNRWRFDRKINVLREFFDALPDEEWRRRCGEQMIRFWEKQGLAERYADLTAVCDGYIMEFGGGVGTAS